MQPTSIASTTTTVARLKAHGKYGDSLDDIINRALDALDERHGNT